MIIVDIQEIKDRNAERGNYFFSPGAMRFFASRVARQAYLTDTGSAAYFVTSEQFTPSTGKPEPRLYTVRAIDMTTGDIDTCDPEAGVDGFQFYTTRAAADKVARSLAASGNTKVA
jgi:hypothetical protein